MNRAPVFLAMLLLFAASAIADSPYPKLSDASCPGASDTLYRIDFDLPLVSAQGALGWDEVTERAHDIARMSDQRFEKYLARKGQTTQAVLGPDGRVYVINGNHLVAALTKAQKKYVLGKVFADFSCDAKISQREFVLWMMQQNAVWLYDQSDRPIKFTELNDDFLDIPDDPYRSLVWKLIDRGDVLKTGNRFDEFRVGRYLRRKARELGKDRLALHEASALVRDPKAKGKFPGYAGTLRERCVRALILRFIKNP